MTPALQDQATKALIDLARALRAMLQDRPAEGGDPTPSLEDALRICDTLRAWMPVRGYSVALRAGDLTQEPTTWTQWEALATDAAHALAIHLWMREQPPGATIPAVLDLRGYASTRVITLEGMYIRLQPASMGGFGLNTSGGPGTDGERLAEINEQWKAWQSAAELLDAAAVTS